MATIIYSWQCNKQCHYCNVYEKYDKKNEPYISDELNNELILIFEDMVKRKDSVILSGGEPGLISERTLDSFFDKLPLNLVIVFTNGLFIKNNYHLKYASKIKYYIIHLIGDENPDNLPYDISKDKGKYIYVVTKKNVNSLDLLAQKFSNININIKLFEGPRVDLKLDNIDMDTIKKFSHEYDNIIYDDVDIDDIEQSTPNNFLNLCKQFAIEVEIDIPKNKLNHCCNSTDKTVGITYEKYISMKNGSYDMSLKGTPDCNECDLFKQQFKRMSLQLIKDYCRNTL